MGLFTKKGDKIYSLKEALKLLKMPQYKDYTTVPVEDGFKLVCEVESAKNNDDIEVDGFKQRRGNFVNQISGQGTYCSISTVPNYNNYQSAKRYRSNIYKSLER